MSEMRGRPAILLTPLSAFTTGYNGNPPIMPKDKELVYDDLGDGSIGRIELNGEGGFEFVSTCQDMNTFLTNMENTGLFDNAAAGVIGKELNYFLYNNDTKSIVFNDKLRYPENFMYYAIRKGTTYITERDVDGTIVNVVDMEAVETTTGSEVIVRKPKVGMMAADAGVVDGDNYIVEFFDASRRLIGRDVFYAEHAATFTGDTSETAISEMRVITTRPYPEGGEDSAYLYKGESVNQLGYSLILVYNNGDTKDITHEAIEVNGLNTVLTDNLTGDSPYTVTFTYNPPDGAVSVSTTLDIHVITDVTAEVLEMLPVYYVSGNDLSTDVVRKYFGIMSDFSFYEITSKLAADQPSEHGIPTSTGVIESVTTIMNLGLFGQDEEEYNYAIRFSTESVDGSSILRTEFSSQSNPFTDKYYKRITSVDSNTLSLGSIDVVNDGLERLGVTPTHFRIRTIEGVSVTGNVLITDSENIPKLPNIDSIVANKNKPVIVEFFKVEGTPGNPDYSIQITKCLVAYFN